MLHFTITPFVAVLMSQDIAFGLMKPVTIVMGSIAANYY